jgi:hypothetical protein
VNRVFTIVLLFTALFSGAQTVLHSSGDTAQKHVGIHVTILNPNGKQGITYQGNAVHTDSVVNALKFSVTGFFRGDHEVYFERRLSDALSVEAAGGITYIDYMYEMYQNGGRYFALMNNGERNSKFYTGLAGGIQLRYYTSKYETAITGFYLAPGIAYRQYRMDYMVFTGLMSEAHPLNRTLTDIKLQLGWQNADPYNSIFWEFYLSAGLRHTVEDYVETNNYVEEFIHDDYWHPVVGAGLKLGFAL